MDTFWKWLERIAAFTAIISFLKWWDMEDIMIFLKQLWNSFTAWQFLFFLSIIVLLYRFVIFLVNIHRLTKELKNVDDKIGNITGNINELKEWIGLLSYKDRYSDLKGKINFFVKEELEKESRDQKDETRKYKALDKLQGLDYEEAFGKLTPDERERYLQYKDKE